MTQPVTPQGTHPGAPSVPHSAPSPAPRLATGAAACVAAYLLVFAAGDLDHHRARLAAVILPTWLVFAVATWWATSGRRQVRRPVTTVLVLAAVVQLPGLFAAPATSSDAYRYVWDGRVQLSGASPYRYAPLDDRVAALRDPVLFPGLGPSERSGFTTRPLPTDRDALLAFSRDDDRTLINRPKVPTIYPPVAQAWFTGIAAVTPWSWGTRGLQLASALLAVALAAAIAQWLMRRGRDPLHALWFAWAPVAVVESGNGAHVDVLATAFVAGAVTLASSSAAHRWLPAATGALVGLAASVKLTPLALLPAFMPLRRKDAMPLRSGDAMPLRSGGWRSALPTPAAAVATLAATYLPHLLVAGGLVVGYLPGYLREEGGDNRSALLRLVLPDGAVAPASLALMAAVAVWALARTEAAPEHAAAVLFGALLIVTTPSYPWYAMPLALLAVMAGRLEWLAVAVAGYVAYAGLRVPPTTALAYGVAAVVVAAATWRRRSRQTPE